jgi:hypothetical protein
MRYTKILTRTVMVAGILVAYSQAKAEEPYGRDRDLRHDYARAHALRRDIAADQYRMNEDVRCGRRYAAASEARDIARDRAALRAQERDIYRDRRW